MGNLGTESDNRPKSVSAKLSRRLGTNEDLERESKRGRNRPQTVTEKIAYLCEFDSADGTGTETAAASQSRRRKPRSTVGVITFLCGTRKSKVRRFLAMLIFVAFVYGVARPGFQLIPERATSRDEPHAEIMQPAAFVLLVNFLLS